MAKKVSIDQQIKLLEEQMKILREKKKKEQESQLKGIGEIVAKLAGGIENVNRDLLKEVMEKYYLPLPSQGSKNLIPPPKELELY